MLWIQGLFREKSIKCLTFLMRDIIGIMEALQLSKETWKYNIITKIWLGDERLMGLKEIFPSKMKMDSKVRCI